MKISLHPKFADVIEVRLDRFVDERGWMARVLDSEVFEEAGIPGEFSQISHSRTNRAGVLRGLFVSLPPSQEGKLVRVLKGRMQWVLVDLRLGSAAYGQSGEVILDGKEGNAFFAPRGFAHGCLCLEDETDLILMADTPYSPEHSTGIRWDDPDLCIPWRLNEVTETKVSEAHMAYGSFQDFVKRQQTVKQQA